MVPIAAELPIEVEYRSLAEAVADETLTITEIGQGGSVPDLRAANAGDTAVLIVDGEELVVTLHEPGDVVDHDLRVGEARREELRISSRLDHLRAAITEVEIKIHDLAALATPYTEQIAEIIDLTAIEEDQPLTGSGLS